MEIIRGKIKKPQKVVVYGPEGIGKSTMASQFPNPLFIDTEGSTSHLDVARTKAPSSWTMLMDQVKTIRRDSMGFGTLVIDTADWAERLCVESICARSQKNGIEDFGYGKGYTYLKEEFGKLLNLLEEVVESGLHVVLTAHATMRKIEQPEETGAYDHWELKLSKQVAPLVKEWSDLLLFANYKIFVTNVDGQGAAKGKNKANGGRRVMYASHQPAWDAKNRHGLPDEMPFEYSGIAHLFSQHISVENARKDTESVQTPAENAQNAGKSDRENVKSASHTTKSVPIPDFMKIEDMDAEAGEVPFGEDKEQEAGSRSVRQSNPPASETKGSGVPSGGKLSGPRGKLQELMESKLISEEELRWVVAKKGYFTQNTPIDKYPEDFIAGWCIPYFDNIYEMIRGELDKQNPFTH